MLTSPDGSFRFTGISAGDYILSARKDGYIGGYFGQNRPGGSSQVFDLRAGEVASGVTLRLWPHGVIAGSVRTASGLPIAGAVVQGLRLGANNRGEDTVFSSLINSTSDDRGEYRLGGLFPGRYLVCAAVPGSFTGASGRTPVPTRDPGKAPLLPIGERDCNAFAPRGRAITQAEEVTLSAPGEMRFGVDIEVTDSPAGVAIAGRVLGLPAGFATPTARLVLADGANGVPPGYEIDSVTLTGAGAFVFRMVPPGAYLVRGIAMPRMPEAASPFFVAPRHTSSTRVTPGPDWRTPIAPLPDERAVWFSERVDVDTRPILDLSLIAQPGAVVTGRVDPDQNLRLSADDLLATAVSVRPAAGGWNLDRLPLGRLESGGTFRSPALPPGRFLVLPLARGDWHVDRALLGGNDVRSEGVEIAGADLSDLTVTLTRRQAIVTGLVRDASNVARSDASVYVFPAAAPDWEFGVIAAVRPNRAGEYRVVLHSGSWALAAAAGNIPDTPERPFLRSLMGRASTIALAAGQQERVNLTVQVIQTR